MGTLPIAHHQLFVKAKTALLQRDKIALSGLLAGGLFLRLWQINGSLWYDEAFSAHLAGLPLSNLFTATLYDVHPPTYYLLLWTVTRLVGHSSEFILRLPSLVSGLALIWLVYRLARVLQLSDTSTWLATGLAALSPFQIYYSNEARPYALQMVLITAAAVGFLEKRDWLLITCSLVAAYLHNLSGLFLTGLFMAAFIWDHLRVKRLFNAGAFVFVGWLPVAGLTIYQSQHIHHNYWIPGLSSPGRVLAMLDDLIFLAPGNTFVVATGLATALSLLLIIRAVPAALLATNYTPIFLFVITGLPLALATAISLVWQPIMISRALAPVAPFYYLLLAWAVSVTLRRITAWSVMTLPALAAVLAGMMGSHFGHLPVKQDYLSLYGLLRPTDGVFHANVGSFMTWHYYRPEISQYVLYQDGELNETLTNQTKAAMNIPQAVFAEIVCEQPRWWLIQFDNPLSSPAEIAYIESVAKRHQAKKIALLRQDVTVEAWLYLISPAECEAK